MMMKILVYYKINKLMFNYLKIIQYKENKDYKMFIKIWL